MSKNKLNIPTFYIFSTQIRHLITTFRKTCIGNLTKTFALAATQ